MTFHLSRLFAIRFPGIRSLLPIMSRAEETVVYTKKGLAGYCERVFVNKRTVKC